MIRNFTISKRIYVLYKNTIGNLTCETRFIVKYTILRERVLYFRKSSGETHTGNYKARLDLQRYN